MTHQIPSGINPKEKGRAPEGCGRKELNVNNIASITGETSLIRRSPAKTLNIAPPVAYSGTIEMTAAEWAGVTDNPRQRDTESRANRAVHLQSPHPSHCKVNMARLPGGQNYKLDGHTRSFMWSTGRVAPPPVLYVDVWDCRTLTDAKLLYETFDSKAAVESTSDQVFGAKRDQNISFTSTLLKGGKFAAGMRFAEACLHGSPSAKAMSIYDLLKSWKKELELFDLCEPNGRRFHTGIVAAALLCFRRYGDEASDFWGNFASGTGTKANGVTDAVQALEERMESRRLENRIQGQNNYLEIVGIAISAFERYRHGEGYLSEGRKDESGKALRGSGIKMTKGESFRDWMISAKRASSRGMI